LGLLRFAPVVPQAKVLTAGQIIFGRHFVGKLHSVRCILETDLEGVPGGVDLAWEAAVFKIMKSFVQRADIVDPQRDSAWTIWSAKDKGLGSFLMGLASTPRREISS
jgi:hypothetical protein